MKEFIEKLISKLEEIYNRNDKVKKKAYEEQDWEHFDLFTHRNEGVYTSISIVHQLAEEYNNGWIPCSERLPEGNKAVLVCTNAGQIDVDYYGEYIKDFIGLKGTEQHAIAWQPLPVPFKKVGAV